MIRAGLLALSLTGCVAPAADEARRPEPPFRACLALPVPLPPLRTIEALKAREERLEFVALDCAERLRRTVEAWPR